MDLGSVRAKLKAGAYDDAAEAFAADVRLVFDNAMLYNADPTHVVHAAAERLRARFDALFATSS